MPKLPALKSHQSCVSGHPPWIAGPCSLITLSILGGMTRGKFQRFGFDRSLIMALVGRRDGRNFGYGRQLSYAGPQALRDLFGGGITVRSTRTVNAGRRLFVGVGRRKAFRNAAHLHPHNSPAMPGPRTGNADSRRTRRTPNAALGGHRPVGASHRHALTQGHFSGPTAFKT